MCGILGSVTSAPTGPRRLGRRLVARARATGAPDASGSRAFAGSAATCVLGHTRLRILDLSAAGDQPLSNEDGTVWTVFNGELYNFQELRTGLRRRGHHFRSSTDTEVIVHLHEEAGDGLVPALSGMYAFAVWDTRSEGSCSLGTASGSSRSTTASTATHCGSRPRPACWRRRPTSTSNRSRPSFAVATKQEIALAIIGGLFVLEAVSVIVQVISFRLTGKRVFRMAPLHHHFEQKGWTEPQIVIRFWIISIVLALAGLSTLKLR